MRLFSTFCRVASVAPLLLVGLSAAFAQSAGSDKDKWPASPIRMIIPFTAGGPIDLFFKERYP